MPFKYFYFLIFCSLSFQSFTQNNLIIFSEDAQSFQIEYKNQLFPPIPQTDVKLTRITENPVHLKIIFSNLSLPPLDTTLYLYHPSKPIQNQDIIYLITCHPGNIKYLATLPSSDLKPIIPIIDTSIVVKSREEKNIQKIIFLNNTLTKCLVPIDTFDFNKAINYIHQTPNIEQKMVLLEQFIQHNCFNSSQAHSIIEQIPFEVEKLRVMKQLLPKLTSVFNLEHWKDYLRYNTAQQSYIEYYSSYLHSLNTNPVIDDSLFSQILLQVQSINDERTKTNTIKIYLSHYSITFNQLIDLIKLLSHDNSREDILKCAYYSLLQKKDFLKTIDYIQFNETKQRLKFFYDKQK